MLMKIIAFRGKDYCVLIDFSWKEKFWLKFLKVNHGIKGNKLKVNVIMSMVVKCNMYVNCYNVYIFIEIV